MSGSKSDNYNELLNGLDDGELGVDEEDNDEVIQGLVNDLATRLG
jgi:hypothetical protein